MKEKAIKTIGKESEKIGNTIVTGEGAQVELVKDKPETVAVRDYVSQKGYSGIVNWDGENPTVAGVKVNPTEIKNGIAYAKKDDVDALISNMEKNAGIKNPEKMRDEKYGKIEEDALNAMLNRKPFSYDVENDIVYQSYKKQYEREAEHALRRILNDNNTSVTGASGAVLSEAMAAQNAQLEKITDKIPELYKDAYERYNKDGETMYKNFDAINKIADNYYDRLYKSNEAIKDSIVKAGKEERDERQRILENERLVEKDIYENALKEIELLYYGDEMESDIIETRVSAENTAIDNALARGFFVESDEIAIPWLENYRMTNGSYSISPSAAKLTDEYQSSRARERGKIHARIGL